MAKTITRQQKPINFKSHTKRVARQVFKKNKLSKGAAKTINDIIVNLIANITEVAAEHTAGRNRKIIAKRDVKASSNVLLGNNLLRN